MRTIAHLVQKTLLSQPHLFPPSRGLHILGILRLILSPMQDPAHWNVYLHGLGFLSAFTMAAGAGRYQEVQSSAGKRQYEMEFGMSEPFMMLISDMALVWDTEFHRHLMWYDQHRVEFRMDAADAWKKLTELGCEEGQLMEELNPPVDHPF